MKSTVQDLFFVLCSLCSSNLGIPFSLGTSLITAANFCQNGKLAVVGTYDGRCIFYDTEVCIIIIITIILKAVRHGSDWPPIFFHFFKSCFAVP